jgi:hypothetical protein
MKRRKFGLLTGASLAGCALDSVPTRSASAQTAADPALLTTTLTPLGGERAGNAAGTIPAWTGGMTAVPAEYSSWDPSRQLPPDFWPDDKPLYVISPSNMSQYVNLLTEGLQTMVQKYGMTINVYQTRRTVAAPQWVYDNTAANVGRAKLDPKGGRFGFTGAYGGIPFPIPDSSDPFNAGVQAIWNHECRWEGPYANRTAGDFVVVGGVTTLSSANTTLQINPYYQQDGSVDTYDGYSYKLNNLQIAPANVVGGQIVHFESSNTSINANITWQLLAGQGRVRKAPEVSYDTPSAFSDGLCNYDEYYGFGGAADRYDWKMLGKQEMLVPYNCNKLLTLTSTEAHLPHFINPIGMRWELHRVWVVEATLHPGERNVMARRRFYIDEDCWTVMIADNYDANNALVHHIWVPTTVFPNVPALIATNAMAYNFLTNNYTSLGGPWADPPLNRPWTDTPIDSSTFNPQSMASSANY